MLERCRNHYEVGGLAIPIKQFAKPPLRRELTLGYPIAFAIEKIGRYIATTMKPTVVPKNTIIMGSKSAVRFPTASSTSSS